MKNNQPVTHREIDYSADLVFISKTDTKGIVTYANDSFVELSGFSREELIGKNHNVVRHPDMPEWAFADLWRTVKSGYPWTGIVKNRAKNGDHYWVKASVSPINDNGTTLGYISLRKKPTRKEIEAAQSLYSSEGIPTQQQSWSRRFVNLALETKLQLFIQPVMFLFLMLSMLTTAMNTREQLLHNARHEAFGIANELLDSSNLMMVTGQISNPQTRKLMRDKIAKSNNLVSLDLLRSNHVASQFGKGLSEEQVQNDLHRQVFESKQPWISMDGTNTQPILHAVVPFVASRDHNGTDCIACHQVAEGEVLGIADLRIDLSDEYRDFYIFIGKLFAGQIFAQLFLFFFIRWIVRRFVARPVASINGHLERLVNGDSGMSNHADIHRRDEMGQIMCSVQSTKVMMGSMIDHMAAAANNLDERSQRLSQAVSQLSEASVTQYDSASSMAAAVEQMSVSMDQIAKNAEDVKETSENAKHLADNGKQVVEHAAKNIRETNDSMHQVADTIRELGERSEHIQGIVNMIKAIAAQTNLLALNAAIEAARAGNHGKGFSVVADEVHKLSEQTSVATQEIQVIVTSFRETSERAVQAMQDAIEKMESGAALTEEAGLAIVEIDEGAHRVLIGIGDILDSLKEQATAGQEIATNVEKVAQMTEKNRITVESVDRTADKLSAFSMELKSTSCHFKI